MIIELLFVLAAIVVGARLGGVGLGVSGGLGLAILVFCFGLEPTSPPIDVMLMIAAVIAAASCMLKCDGIDSNGKFIIEDTNKDGQITDDDRTYCGSAQPKLTYGWNNTFSYKNWDASFFIRGTIGNKVLDNPLAAYGNTTYLAGNNVMKNKYLGVLKENSRVCSFYVEDASFARLDNMSIGYTFNTKSINWLEKARVYVAAQNLFVITGYKGLDPEVELYTGDPSDTDAGLSPGIEPRNFMEKKDEHNDNRKNGRYLRREFSYSKFQQTMVLPDNVEKDKIEAKVENGVLNISIPKKTEEEVKKAAKVIEIR